MCSVLNVKNIVRFRNEYVDKFIAGVFSSIIFQSLFLIFKEITEKKSKNRVDIVRKENR